VIAKAPLAPSCTRKATRYRLLWDFNKGQTGVAPNAIELHPVLGFACLST
jgi:hypothetical protein